MNKLSWRGHETFAQARARSIRWQRFIDGPLPSVLLIAAALGAAFVLRAMGVL